MYGTEFYVCTITGLPYDPCAVLICIVPERFVPVHVVKCMWRSPYCASDVATCSSTPSIYLETITKRDITPVLHSFGYIP